MLARQEPQLAARHTGGEPGCRVGLFKFFGQRAADEGTRDAASSPNCHREAKPTPGEVASVDSRQPAGGPSLGEPCAASSGHDASAVNLAVMCWQFVQHQCGSTGRTPRETGGLSDRSDHSRSGIVWLNAPPASSGQTLASADWRDRFPLPVRDCRVIRRRGIDDFATVLVLPVLLLPVEASCHKRYPGAQLSMFHAASIVTDRSCKIVQFMRIVDTAGRFSVTPVTRTAARLPPSPGMCEISDRTHRKRTPLRDVQGIEPPAACRLIGHCDAGHTDGDKPRFA
jgi:hypothetical protein